MPLNKCWHFFGNVIALVSLLVYIFLPIIFNFYVFFLVCLYIYWLFVFFFLSIYLFF